MGVNHKVGMIRIALRNNNPYSNELIEQINRNYKNLYNIVIEDYSDRINEEMYNKLKTMIEHKTLFTFELLFMYGSSLFDNNDALRLMKDYNLIIKR